VGRAASVLSPRVAAAAVLVAGLAAYASVVDELPQMSLWWDVALAALVLMPATTALAWLALPLRTWRGLAGLGLALAALAFACDAAGLDVASNLAKTGAVLFVGLWFLDLFERPWWVGLVALAIPLVDAISVWRGPTRHIVTERPGVFDLLSISFPVPGGSFQLGLPDLLFFTLFLAAAARWSMRVAPSWVLMTASFGATMALALWLDPFDLGGLPALPLLSLGFLLANGDLLLRSARLPEPEDESDENGGDEPRADADAGSSAEAEPNADARARSRLSPDGSSRGPRC
jgi:hypothetical protein